MSHRIERKCLQFWSQRVRVAQPNVLFEKIGLFWFWSWLFELESTRFNWVHPSGRNKFVVGFARHMICNIQRQESHTNMHTVTESSETLKALTYDVRVWSQTSVL